MAFFHLLKPGHQPSGRLLDALYGGAPAHKTLLAFAQLGIELRRGRLAPYIDCVRGSVQHGAQAQGQGACQACGKFRLGQPQGAAHPEVAQVAGLDLVEFLLESAQQRRRGHLQ